MLERVDRDGALARLRVEVRRLALPIGVRPLVGLPEAGPGHLLVGESPRRIDLRELEVGRARVVVGHGPADDDGPARRLGLARLLDLARELMDVRRHEIAHADPHQIADAARRHVHHARLGRQPVELGDDAERLGELIAAAQRVQERGVDRVHAVVFHLEGARSCRNAGTRADSPAARGRRTPAPRTRESDRRPGERAPGAGYREARRASRDTARRRHTPSRDSSSGSRARLGSRIRATSPGARSAGAARRFARRDHGTPPGPRPGCARGGAWR